MTGPSKRLQEVQCIAELLSLSGEACCVGGEAVVFPVGSRLIYLGLRHRCLARWK